MAMVVTALSGVFLAFGALLLLIGFLKGKEVYAEWTEPLDEKEFKLKNFLGSGLYWDSKINLLSHLPGGLREMLRRHGSKVNSQIVELYGGQEAEYYGAIHRAQKWVMAFLLCAILAFLGLICVMTGDSSTGLIFAVASPVGLVAGPLLLDSELNSKIEKRRETILMEFPEFVNQLILLVNAGSTIPKAWSKIISESDKSTPLYRELRICVAEIQAGKAEAVAYEEFGRRCRIKEVIKFVSVIILNLRKGGADVVPTLRAQADECWEARRATARRLGEKASSKLLGPMAIMLLGIIAIVALPAVLALMGM